MRADMLASSLDGISFGVLLLDARGKLLEANAVGQEALRPENGLSRRNDGTLKLREPAGAQFAKWLGSGTPPPENADGLLHIERVGAQRLSLLLTRLPHMGTAWMREDPRWMILIFDLERSIQARLHLIEQDLRVSTREAEVAGLLFAGLSLSEISQRLGVSTHTVRSQIKSIFRKTGTQSQSDLIRRIALGPAVSSSRHTVVTPPSKT